MAQDFHEVGIPLAVGSAVGMWRRWDTVRFLRHELRGHWPSVLHTHLGADVWGGLVARQEKMHSWITTIHDVQTPTWMKRWMRRQALRSADHIVCISDVVKDHLKRVYGRTEDVSLIRLGIPFYHLPSTSLAGGHDPRPHRRLQRFVVVGRLIPDKRVDVLIAALAGIREPWHLDVVGDGPERIRLEQMVEVLRLRARVRFVGSQADIYPYLRESDICLFASREEGQGMVVLEAAAAGVPVIASDLPALRELFNEASMSFVSPQADARIWMQIIQQVMYDPEGALERADKARMIVEDKCSIERMVEEYATLYHRLYAHSSR